LTLQYDEVLSNLAFRFNLRRYSLVAAGGADRTVRVLDVSGRGSHSFTFQLNLSAFHGIGGAFRGCLGVLSRFQGV